MRSRSLLTLLALRFLSLSLDAQTPELSKNVKEFVRVATQKLCSHTCA